MYAKCRCGKIAWPSEAEAKDVLVRAKIRAALHGNTKRQEARAYHCDVAPGWWHLTSLADWEDPAARRAVVRATGADRDADVERLLELFEQHHAATARLIVRAEKHEREAVALRAIIRKLTGNAADDPDAQHGNGYAPSRLTAMGMTMLGLKTVRRATLRALLPTGVVRNGDNKTSAKFVAALRMFADKGWIERGTEYVQLLDLDALAEHATRGISDVAALRSALDIERACEVVRYMPPSEQREAERAALETLRGADLAALDQDAER